MQGIRDRKTTTLTESYYAEDAELLVPNRPGITGKAAIARFWQEMFDMGLTKILLNSTHVEVSGDLAHARGQSAFTFTSGGEVRQDKGKYLLTYRRQQDGSWRVVAEMYNSDIKE